jgi:thiol:disulfide interchange protein DsbC
VKYTRNSLLVLALTVVAFVWLLPSASSATQCPSPEKVSEAFVKVFKRDTKVIRVQESAIPGLCEVAISMNARNSIVYVDPDVKFFVAGQIISVEEGKSLTQEAMQELNRLTKEDIQKLDSLTAFTEGKSGKTFYYVTDPQCPYCKKGEEVLKKLIDEGKITVKFLFFPLPMHQGAEQQCVSIICDNKGIKGLEEGYKSENQCPEGVKKVQDTVALLKEKGMSGTPVYIFPDGSYHPGFMQEDMLLKTLGIEPEKPASGEAKKPEQAPVPGETKKADQPAPKQKQE